MYRLVRRTSKERAPKTKNRHTKTEHNKRNHKILSEIIIRFYCIARNVCNQMDVRNIMITRRLLVFLHGFLVRCVRVHGQTQWWFYQWEDVWCESLCWLHMILVWQEATTFFSMSKYFRWAVRVFLWVCLRRSPRTPVRASNYTNMQLHCHSIGCAFTFAVLPISLSAPLC